MKIIFESNVVWKSTNLQAEDPAKHPEFQKADYSANVWK